MQPLTVLLIFRNATDPSLTTWRNKLISPSACDRFSSIGSSKWPKNTKFTTKRSSWPCHLSTVSFRTCLCCAGNCNSSALPPCSSHRKSFFPFSLVLCFLLSDCNSKCCIDRKYEEIYPPEVGEFVYITDDTYTKKQVLRMEHLILKVLAFELAVPTSHYFLQRYIQLSRSSETTLHLSTVILIACFRHCVAS